VASSGRDGQVTPTHIMYTNRCISTCEDPLKQLLTDVKEKSEICLRHEILSTFFIAGMKS
jgi:hypothetical protein